MFGNLRGSDWLGFSTTARKEHNMLISGQSNLKLSLGYNEHTAGKRGNNP